MYNRILLVVSSFAACVVVANDTLLPERALESKIAPHNNVEPLFDVFPMIEFWNDAIMFTQGTQATWYKQLHFPMAHAQQVKDDCIIIPGSFNYNKNPYTLWITKINDKHHYRMAILAAGLIEAKKLQDTNKICFQMEIESHNLFEEIIGALQHQEKKVQAFEKRLHASVLSSFS